MAFSAVARTLVECVSAPFSCGFYPSSCCSRGVDALDISPSALRISTDPVSAEAVY